MALSDTISKLFMVAGLIIILGETIYAGRQTKDNARISRDDYKINVFIGTFIGLLAFSIGATLFVYNNYDEKKVRLLLIIAVGVSCYISLLTIGISTTRLRNATLT